MIPLLLDGLTIIFIVGGLVLLWVNLRGSRLRGARMVQPEHTAAHVDVAPAADMPDQEPGAEACRAQAEECLEQAERSMSQANKQAWLQMGVEWIKLSQVIERRSDGASLDPTSNLDTV